MRRGGGMSFDTCIIFVLTPNADIDAHLNRSTIEEQEFSECVWILDMQRRSMYNQQEELSADDITDMLSRRFPSHEEQATRRSVRGEESARSIAATQEVAWHNPSFLISDDVFPLWIADGSTRSMYNQQEELSDDDDVVPDMNWPSAEEQAARRSVRGHNITRSIAAAQEVGWHNPSFLFSDDVFPLWIADMQRRSMDNQQEELSDDDDMPDMNWPSAEEQAAHRSVRGHNIARSIAAEQEIGRNKPSYLVAVAHLVAIAYHNPQKLPYLLELADIIATAAYNNDGHPILIFVQEACAFANTLPSSPGVLLEPALSLPRVPPSEAGWNTDFAFPG